MSAHSRIELQTYKGESFACAAHVTAISRKRVVTICARNTDCSADIFATPTEARAIAYALLAAADACDAMPKQEEK